MSLYSTMIEPHLEDLLADPIIQMVMKKDGVEEDDLRPLIQHVSDWLDSRTMAFN